VDADHAILVLGLVDEFEKGTIIRSHLPVHDNPRSWKEKTLFLMKVPAKAAIPPRESDILNRKGSEETCVACKDGLPSGMLVE
jgi:hypothetical protein